MVKSVLGLEVKDQTEANAHLIMQKMYFHSDGYDRTPEALSALININHQQVCDVLESYPLFFWVREGGLDGPKVKYYMLNPAGRSFVRLTFVLKNCPHCGTHLVCPDCGTVIE